MKKSKGKGLGIYLLVFLIALCVIIWIQNSNKFTDVTYTIDEFKNDVTNDLIQAVDIFQNP